MARRPQPASRHRIRQQDLAHVRRKPVIHFEGIPGYFERHPAVGTDRLQEPVPARPGVGEPGMLFSLLVRQPLANMDVPGVQVKPQIPWHRRLLSPGGFGAQDGRGAACLHTLVRAHGAGPGPMWAVRRRGRPNRQASSTAHVKARRTLLPALRCRLRPRIRSRLGQGSTELLAARLDSIMPTDKFGLDHPSNAEEEPNTVAMDKVALLDVLRKAGVAGDVDFLRASLQALAQALVDLEASERIGAA